MTSSVRARGSGALGRARGVGLAAAVCLLAACSPAGAAPAAVPDPADRTSSATAVTGQVVVFAASSLSEVLADLAAAFEDAHRGVSVRTSVGASSALAQQVLSGAPADVFASANTATMDSVVAVEGGEPSVLAGNVLEIAVPAGNPAGVTGLADLADPALTIALCAPEVPCGSAAAEVFAAAGLTPAPDTLEKDASATLTKVRLGEVDAALVYRTDVIRGGEDVEGIEFPESRAAANDYPILALPGAPNPRAAAAFVEFVLSAPAQRVLADAGFAIP